MELDNLSLTKIQSLSNLNISVPISNALSSKNFSHKDLEHSTSGSTITISKAAFGKYASAYSASPQIHYEMDEESKRIVANVVDPESGEVIRQIPDEKFQQLFRRIEKFQEEVLDLKSSNSE